MPRDDREFRLGDLVEEFHAVVVPEVGARSARRWFWRHAVRCLLVGRGAGIPVVLASTRGGPMLLLRAIGRDVGYALRLMRRAPLVSIASVLTFALGIGANVAIFSVGKPVLFDPLPFPDEDGLAAIWLTYPTSSGGVARNTVSAGDFDAMRAAPAFERVEAFTRFTAERNLPGFEEPRQIAVGSVTGGFFTALRVQAVAGRPLIPADAGSGASVIVLSESLWSSFYGRDPSIAGRSIPLDGQPYEVVGVVPDWVGIGTRPADAWTPLRLDEQIRTRLRAYFLGVIGRLRPGETLDTANEQLAGIMARLAVEYPESNGNPVLSAEAASFREELTGPVRPTFLVLIGGAAVVLIIATINLAGLQLVRQTGRTQEFAVRQAIGASRGRLAGLVLVDSVVQAAVGGAAGLLCAGLTLRLLRPLAPADTWYEIPASPAFPVLVFAAGLSLTAGVLVGLLPAVRAAAGSIATAVRSRLTIADRSTRRGRTILVAAQVALTLALLTVASLVAASLVRVLRVDPGFTTTGLLVANFTLPGAKYDTATDRSRFYDDLVDRLNGLPGVAGACVANDVPLDSDQGGMTWVADGDPDGRMVGSTPKVVSPGCFEALGVPLLAGRLFEGRGDAQEVIVSRAMARSLWPDEPDGFNPVGRQIHMGTPNGWLMTIVGVAGDIRNSSLESAYLRQVWLPHSLGLWPPKRVIVRAAQATPDARLAAASLAPGLRRVMAELDAGVALADVRTIDQIVSSATSSRRFVLFLLGGFGVVALLLSGVGIYGVLAHVVAQRTPEIGMRMALGATAANIARLVAGRLAGALLAGVVAGSAGAFAASSYVATLLFDTSATDARVYAGVAVFVGLTAAAAAWSPVRRAVRVDPVDALKGVRS
jgi:predicted permease